MASNKAARTEPARRMAAAETRRGLLPAVKSGFKSSSSPPIRVRLRIRQFGRRIGGGGFELGHDSGSGSRPNPLSAQA